MANNPVEQQSVTAVHPPCWPWTGQGSSFYHVHPGMNERPRLWEAPLPRAKGEEGVYQPTLPFKSAQQGTTHSPLANTSCLPFPTSREQRRQSYSALETHRKYLVGSTNNHHPFSVHKPSLPPREALKSSLDGRAPSWKSIPIHFLHTSLSASPGCLLPPG